MRRGIFGGVCAVLFLSSATAFAQDAARTDATGPSTRTPPYLVRVDDKVSFVSILTAGDPVGSKSDRVTPWRMVGAPDGLGAFDNGDGTITVLMNHELGANAGVMRRHGAAGAFVSRLVVDKATLRVASASDLIEKAFRFDPASRHYVELKSPLRKLCSADLPGGSALYDAASKLGYDGKVFLGGEEDDPEGRPFAHFVTGAEAGASYELAWLGNMAFENVLAYPRGGRRTVVAMTDDSRRKGELYFYAGDKRAEGDAVERAGLAHGRLYGLKLEKLPEEIDDLSALGEEMASAFTLVDLGDASGRTGAEIDAESKKIGITAFQRPEDGAWDEASPNRFYFNTTNANGRPSRLWAVDFEDATHPERGGTVKVLLEGHEGQDMLDNMTVTRDGHVFLQEDPGDSERLAGVFEFDPREPRKLRKLAQHDPALFGDRNAPGFLSAGEESSGILDVTPLLGSARRRAFLLDVQTHQKLGGETVEGGQLLLMWRELPQ
jgi:hypothetical protein